ncbi:MAG: fatty acyl-AMP ligase [Gammaproteobacteria bacterium]|nr:fatty acyl-AMP ligase [Gammaproteobacteria bacterium]
METILTRLDNNSARTNAEWYFPAESCSFDLSTLRDQSLKLTSVLHANGLKKGDRVALMMTNSSSYVIALLAIWRLNAIAVPLRPKGSRQTHYADYIQHCNEICNFSLMLFDDVVTSEIFRHPDLSQQHYADINTLIEAATHIPAFNSEVKISGADIAILQFSSGSTGAPKGVIVTHDMMMAQLQNIHYNHIGSRRGRPIESLASWMPFNHDMGLFIGMLAPVYTGSNNMVAPPAFYMRNPPRWFSLMSQRHVDMNFNTNSVLASTLKTLRRLQKQDDIDLSELHLYIGAEKVSPIIVRRCYDYLIPLGFKRENLHIGYGMAENTLGAACTKTQTINLTTFKFISPNCLEPVEESSENSSPDTGKNTIELVATGAMDWRHNITIKDKTGRSLPELTLGEIAIKSPCVTPGYYRDPEKTSEKLIDGCLLTGDIGFMYNNELYFYARQDDMINHAGRNIIPDDVEMAIEELPFIRAGASALVGVDNPQTGCTDLILLAEVSERSTANELTEYQQTIQNTAYEVGDIILTRIILCQRGTIEKTSSGKKRRAVIRKRFAKNQINIVRKNNNEQRAAI